MPRMHRRNESGTPVARSYTVGRAAVDRDLHDERGPFGEEIGDAGRDGGAVSEQRDQKPAALHVEIDVARGRPREGARLP